MTPRSFEGPRSNTPRVVLGVGLMLFGTLILLDRSGLADLVRVLRLWPLVLIAIGVQQLISWSRRNDRDGTVPWGALAWMGIGGLFLLNTLGITRASVFDLFWPVVLIAVGVRLLTHARRTTDIDGPGVGSGDTGPVIAVLSGVKRVSPPEPFRNLDVTLFMGGAQLDYRPAVLGPGQEAVVDMLAIMGGCEIFVPPHWVVSAPVTTILGGIDDRRVGYAPPVTDPSAATAGPPPRLVLRGLVLMGGVTIRS
ncbi:MAG: hypothetical protein JSU08_20000 [Acidobacteria bacterium]|nr:hypothetical protein [Acidobacteriota bacterium]